VAKTVIQIDRGSKIQCCLEQFVQYCVPRPAVKVNEFRRIRQRGGKEGCLSESLLISEQLYCFDSVQVTWFLGKGVHGRQGSGSGRYIVSCFHYTTIACFLREKKWICNTQWLSGAWDSESWRDAML